MNLLHKCAAFFLRICGLKKAYKSIIFYGRGCLGCCIWERHFRTQQLDNFTNFGVRESNQCWMGKLDTQKAHKSLDRAEKKSTMHPKRCFRKCLQFSSSIHFSRRKETLIKIHCCQHWNVYDVGHYLTFLIPSKSLFSIVQALSFFFVSQSTGKWWCKKKFIRLVTSWSAGKKRKYKFAVLLCFLRSSESQLAIWRDKNLLETWNED